MTDGRRWTLPNQERRLRDLPQVLRKHTELDVGITPYLMLLFKAGFLAFNVTVSARACRGEQCSAQQPVGITEA